MLAAANSVLVTSAGKVPSLSTTLPSGLSIPGATITSSTAALTAGSVVAAPVAGIDLVNKTYADGLYTASVHSITGTTNQIIASSPTGDVTLSLPQDIATGSSPTFTTLTLTSLTAHGVLIGEGASPLASIVLGAGQVLIGTTSGDPTAAAINSGQNILVANASGSITVGFTGNLPVTNLNSGTSAGATTFWRGDGTWATPSGTGVSSTTGTANQVLVNGTSGSPQAGAITLTTPQDIGTSSSPTFTAVKTGAILDSNGVDVLEFITASSAVNWLALANSATGGGPTLVPIGSDTNIGIGIITKGIGQLNLSSANTTNPIIINSGTSYQHITNLLFSNTAATRNVTFQDASGTLAYTSDLTGFVTSVSGTSNRITSTGGTTPVIDISASYVGQASITTLGTIGTGVWQGTVVGLAFGGSNANLTASNGGIIYSTATAMAILSGTATAGQMLVSGSNAAPSWSTATFPTTAGSAGTILRSNGTNWVNSTSTFADTYSASTLLYSNGANTVTGLATANSAVLVTNSSGVPAWSGTMTNGQLIIGSTGATPTAATLTAGSGISITNAAGSITIASTTSGMTWTTVSGTTQSAAVNSGYVTNNAGAVTVTLPTTFAVGDAVEIKGLGAGGWVLAAGTATTIRMGTSVTSSAGSLTSANQYDTVKVTGLVANTTWSVDYSLSTGLTVA
jgi:hypothetical protein